MFSLFYFYFVGRLAGTASDVYSFHKLYGVIVCDNIIRVRWQYSYDRPSSLWPELN